MLTYSITLLALIFIDESATDRCLLGIGAISASIDRFDGSVYLVQALSISYLRFSFIKINKQGYL